MSEVRKFTGTVTVEVEVTITDPDVIERVTGPGGDEWRAHLYPLFTEDEVLGHLASNAVMNGVDNASRLDGWADLPPEAAEMRVGWVVDHEISEAPDA